MSLRHFTKQQFSDGTTIDGNRLEKALQDLENWANEIEDTQFKNRWLQSRLVMKYLPPTADYDTTVAGNTVAGNYKHAPFLPVYNSSTDQNPFRLKGNRLFWKEPYSPPTLTYNPAIVPANPDDIYKDQCVWTSALAVGDDPLIIESVDLVLLTYTSEYISDWRYGAGSGGGALGEYSKDLQIQITADNPFLPNVQVKNTVLFHKYFSTSQAAKFTLQPVIASADMNPSLTSVSGMVPVHENSLSMNMDDLNIPIPPYTRIRFSLILPFESGKLPWGDKPWQNAIPTMTLNVLERLTDA